MPLTFMTCSEVWSRTRALDWVLNVGVGSPHGKVKWMDFSAYYCVHMGVSLCK